MIKVGEKNYNCELKLWRGGWNAGYEPDCLGDMDGEMHKHWDAEEEMYIYTEEEFKAFCDFWKSECELANSKGEYSEFLNLSDEEIDNDDEWFFIVEEA